jgi:hypothetical protein
MSESPRDLERRRRCLAVPIAGILGVVLAATSRSWAVAGAMAGGVVLLAALWWRECRPRSGRPPADPA